MLHLTTDAAETCVQACNSFKSELQKARESVTNDERRSSAIGFHTAAQLSGVYDALVGTNLATLTQSFIDQAEAMAMLFASAGGLIDAQDEAVASVLGKSTGPVPELASLSVMSMGTYVCTPDTPTNGYATVGPEDVSGAEFEQIKAGAESASGKLEARGTVPRCRASYRS